jgi:hypothetical protein
MSFVASEEEEGVARTKPALSQTIIVAQRSQREDCGRASVSGASNRCHVRGRVARYHQEQGLEPLPLTIQVSFSTSLCVCVGTHGEGAGTSIAPLSLCVSAETGRDRAGKSGKNLQNYYSAIMNGRRNTRVGI